MQKITPVLAFDDRAEEAVKFYVSVFKNSKIVRTSHYGDAGPGPKGSVMGIDFVLDGQPFMAMNGGPHFKFTDGISLGVECRSQQELDEYTDKLLAGGGKQLPCGWITDRFGVSWQVNTPALREMLDDPDPAKSQRVMQAMLGMKRIDIEGLERAYVGR